MTTLDTEIAEIIAIGPNGQTKINKLKALIEREVEKAFKKILEENTDKDFGTIDFDGIAEQVCEKARGK